MSNFAVNDIQATVQLWLDETESAINNRARRGLGWSGMLANRADAFQEVLAYIKHRGGLSFTEQEADRNARGGS
jgi:hypothetical protein